MGAIFPYSGSQTIIFSFLTHVQIKTCSRVRNVNCYDEIVRLWSRVTFAGNVNVPFRILDLDRLDYHRFLCISFFFYYNCIANYVVWFIDCANFSNDNLCEVRKKLVLYYRNVRERNVLGAITLMVVYFHTYDI